MQRRLPPSLLALHDALLFDLDGTLMHGSTPIPAAADGVRSAREAGRAIVFATNNASRTPAQVVSHLAGVGVEAAADEVVTSPQIAAGLLAQRLPVGAEVLVIGGPSLAEEIRAAGLVPVDRDAPGVEAVVQGWAPQVGWEMLAEGAFAIAHGAAWMATNVDATLPTERGMAPGNGSLVAALRHATGAVPDVAGKPEPGMFRLAAERVGARSPLAVGDRLDTDVECAVRAGIDSLLVLTGVSTALDALHADPVRRPTWILPDLSSLAEPIQPAAFDERAARCGSVSASWDEGDVILHGPAEDPRSLRAALALVVRHHPDDAWTGRVLDETRTVVDPTPR